MAKNEFTLEDLLSQFNGIEKMGNMQSILDMIPGLSGKVSAADLEKAGMKRQKAI